MANFTTLADLYAGADGDTATVGGGRFIKQGNQIDRASSLSHPSGTLILLGKQTFQDEVLWTHSTAAGIAVPATPTSANMTAAGFVAVGAPTSDKNQRIFTIVRTTNALTEPTAAEIAADNGGVSYTPVALDKAKVTNNKRSVRWFTHDGTSWGTGVAEADILMPRNVSIQRTDNSSALATDTEAVDAVDGDFAEIVTANSSYYKDERVAGAWVRRLSQPIASASVDAGETWTAGRDYAIDETATIRIPATGTFIDKDGNALLNGELYQVAYSPAATAGTTFNVAEALKVEALRAPTATPVVTRTSIRALATAVDTEVPSEKAVRTALDAIGAAVTTRLVTGGTPAAGGIYVQVAGATHVAPTLTSGQRTSVVNMQADGSSIETTYLHDGTAQVASVMSKVAASTPMGGASATVDGSAGTVPQPVKGDEIRFLRGDGTWAGLSVTGRYIGSAATFATLPATSTPTGAAVSGDWTALTADEVGTGTAQAPQYQRGVYIYDGTKYTFAVALDAAQVQAMTAASATVDGASGLVPQPVKGDEKKFLRGDATFAAVPVLTEAQAIDRADKTEGAVTGENLMKAARAHLARVFLHYKGSETINFDAVHNGAVGGADSLHMYSWENASNLTNAPQSGAATGVTGHGFYIGSATDGQQFVYFLSDSKSSATEYYRTRAASTWGSWQTVSSDDWKTSAADSQYVSGEHIILGNTHNVKFLNSDGKRAIRLMPATDWANVGTLTCSQSDWAFDGSFPTTGRQEVVLVSNVAAKKFLVSAVATVFVPRSITGSATSTGYDGVPMPVRITVPTGQGLATVTATNGATVSNIDPLSNTCVVTVSGANTVLTHTSSPRNTFTGLQRVGVFTPATPTQYNNVTLNTGIDFTRCDYIRIVSRRTGSGFAISADAPVVIGGASPGMLWDTGVSSYYQGSIASEADALIGRITGLDDMTSGQDIIRIEGWANAANGFVVPTGTTVRTSITLTANAGAVTVNGAPNTTIFSGTSARVMVAVPAGQIVSAVTSSAGVTASISDSRTGAIEVACPADTTGAQSITVTFATPGAAWVLVQANAGVPVALGTIRVQIPTSGNRSMQVASNTGANCSLTIGTFIHSGGAGLGLVSITALPGSFTSVRSWNFTAAGEWQDLFITDTTNNRRYFIRCEIGGGYNNNVFSGYEIL